MGQLTLSVISAAVDSRALRHDEDAPWRLGWVGLTLRCDASLELQAFPFAPHDVAVRTRLELYGSPQPGLRGAFARARFSNHSVDH